VLSGRGLCDELITHPEESYRLCCIVVCDLETSRMGAPYIYDISRLRVNFLKDDKNGLNAAITTIKERHILFVMIQAHSALTYMFNYCSIDLLMQCVSH